MTAEYIIGPITSAETHDLRRRVLRAGTVNAIVKWHGDDEATTVHLGASVDGRIVAISTWLVTPDPVSPELRSMQLRGMATDPASSGRGLGRTLLRTGLERAEADGFERVWANARITALGFYEAAGWTTTGPAFDTSATGLPHRHVHLDLA